MNKNKIILYLLFFLLHLGTANPQAMAQTCNGRVLPKQELQFLELLKIPNVELYKKIILKGAKRILFLGDKGDEAQDFQSVADLLAPHLGDLDIEIVKTDFQCENKTVLEPKPENPLSLQEKKLDHSQKFPFEDNTFDVIVGKRILCFCDGGDTTCGGIKNDSQAANLFFGEVARILNKKNPHAFAFIQGNDRFLKGSMQKEKNFNRILNQTSIKIKTEYPIEKVTILYQELKQFKRPGRIGVSMEVKKGALYEIK